VTIVTELGMNASNYSQEILDTLYRKTSIQY